MSITILSVTLSFPSTCWFVSYLLFLGLLRKQWWYFFYHYLGRPDSDWICKPYAWFLCLTSLHAKRQDQVSPMIVWRGAMTCDQGRNWGYTCNHLFVVAATVPTCFCALKKLPGCRASGPAPKMPKCQACMWSTVWLLSHCGTIWLLIHYKQVLEALVYTQLLQVVNGFWDAFQPSSGFYKLVLNLLCCTSMCVTAQTVRFYVLSKHSFLFFCRTRCRQKCDRMDLTAIHQALSQSVSQNNWTRQLWLF